MARYRVTLKKTVWHTVDVEAPTQERAENEAMFVAPGNPLIWDIDSVKVLDDNDGSTTHTEPGAISFL